MTRVLDSGCARTFYLCGILKAQYTAALHGTRTVHLDLGRFHVEAMSLGQNLDEKCLCGLEV